MFCYKCGAKILDDSKFCKMCGAPMDRENPSDVADEGTAAASSADFVAPRTTTNNTAQNSNTTGSQRLGICPHCGAPISGFQTRCLSCGVDIQYTAPVRIQTVHDLSKQLNDIELEPISSTQYERDTLVANRKANAIKNFVIPNTKADMLELIILAVTNYDDASNSPQEREAWEAKIEQVKQKAEILIPNEKEYYDISRLYNSYVQKVRTEKENNGKSLRIIAFIVVAILVACGIVIYKAVQSEKKKTADIEKALKRGDLISVDVDSDSLEDSYYVDVYDYFDELGFENIRVVAHNDIILGIFAHHGEVEEISINGQTSWSGSSLNSLHPERRCHRQECDTQEFRVLDAALFGLRPTAYRGYQGSEPQQL